MGKPNDFKLNQHAQIYSLLAEKKYSLVNPSGTRAWASNHQSIQPTRKLFGDKTILSDTRQLYCAVRFRGHVAEYKNMTRVEGVYLAVTNLNSTCLQTRAILLRRPRNSWKRSESLIFKVSPRWYHNRPSKSSIPLMKIVFRRCSRMTWSTTLAYRKMLASMLSSMCVPKPI